MHVLVPTLPFASPKPPGPGFGLVLEPARHPAWAPLDAKSRSALASLLSGCAPLTRVVFYALDPAKLGDADRNSHIARQIIDAHDAQPCRTLVLVLGPEISSQHISEKLEAWRFEAVCSAVFAALDAAAGGKTLADPRFGSMSLNTLRSLLSLGPASKAEELWLARDALTSLFGTNGRMKPPVGPEPSTPHPSMPECSAQDGEYRRTLDELVEARAKELLERMSLSSPATAGSGSANEENINELNRTMTLRRHRRPGSTSSLRSMRSVHASRKREPPRHKRLAEKLGLKVVIGLPRADRLRKQLQQHQVVKVRQESIVGTCDTTPV